MAQFDDSQIAKPQLEAGAGRRRSRPTRSRAEAEAGRRKAGRAEDAKQKCPRKRPAAEDVPETKTAAEDEDRRNRAARRQPPRPTPKTAEEKPRRPSRPRPKRRKKLAIQKENKRKQDEYDDAIKKGQDKVKELNDRFADWYFIISDDVYKKIHLGRADIVKKKEAKEAEGEQPEVLDLSNPK